MFVGMERYDWCDGASPDRGDRGTLEKSQGISFLSLRITSHDYFCQNSVYEKTHLFDKNLTFNLKGDL
jgi:hypothetical protein